MQEETAHFPAPVGQLNTSINPVPEDQTASSGLEGGRTLHMAQTYASKTPNTH